MGIKVIVDRDKCMGNGLCEAIHPAVFEVADDGIVVVHEENIREEDHELIARAVNACPALALRFVEEDDAVEVEDDDEDEDAE